MSRIIIVILVLAALLFPITAAAEGNVPAAAATLGKEIDNQIIKRYTGHSAGWGQSSSENKIRAGIMIIGTTPANVSNLQQASPLARQMTEEVSRWLVNRGYRYDEIRKGKDIRFVDRVGEFILTRDVQQLASRNATGQVVLAGTYVMSGQDVRFTISLISTSSNDVLAKASATIPITPDLRPMLVQNGGGASGMTPSVYTRLR